VSGIPGSEAEELRQLPISYIGARGDAIGQED
jgi:hypothetical protein